MFIFKAEKMNAKCNEYEGSLISIFYDSCYIVDFKPLTIIKFYAILFNIKRLRRNQFCYIFMSLLDFYI